ARRCPRTPARARPPRSGGPAAGARRGRRPAWRRSPGPGNRRGRTPAGTARRSRSGEGWCGSGARSALPREAPVARRLGNDGAGLSPFRANKVPNGGPAGSDGPAALPAPAAAPVRDRSVPLPTAVARGRMGGTGTAPASVPGESGGNTRGTLLAFGTRHAESPSRARGSRHDGDPDGPAPDRLLRVVGGRVPVRLRPGSGPRGAGGRPARRPAARDRVGGG